MAGAVQLSLDHFHKGKTNAVPKGCDIDDGMFILDLKITLTHG